MDIVVVSDSHTKTEELLKIRQKHPYASAYLHCGDSEVFEQQLAGFVTVAGNNDYFQGYPNYRCIHVGELKILLIHGHKYPVATRLQQLKDAAKANDCNVVCYGHSHVYAVDEMDGVLLVNPGSIWRNRDGKKPCYALIHVEDGKISVERKKI